MPLGIIEILKRVGEDNVKVQFLASDMAGIQLVRKGRESRITFHTDPNVMNPNDVCAEHPRNTGVVLWLPYELVEKARKDYAEGKPIEPSGASNAK